MKIEKQLSTIKDQFYRTYHGEEYFANYDCIITLEKIIADIYKIADSEHKKRIEFIIKQRVENE